MSIFGTGSAKFKFGGDADVDLDYSVLKPKWVLSDYIEHKSVITGQKQFIPLGDYSEFIVDVHLYKYGDPSAKFSEIYDYLHTNVAFWPHSDGSAVKSADDSNTEFFISDMNLSYLEDVDYNDVLSIKFVSSDYTIVSKSLV